MSKSKVHLTPVSNIVNNHLVDKTNVIQREFDSLKDGFTFINTNTNEERVDNLMNVSVYDDIMVYENKQYKILHMLTIG